MDKLLSATAKHVYANKLVSDAEDLIEARSGLTVDIIQKFLTTFGRTLTQDQIQWEDEPENSCLILYEDIEFYCNIRYEGPAFYITQPCFVCSKKLISGPVESIVDLGK